MRNGDYLLSIAPDNYPGKLYRGRYCYDHHLVWWINYSEIIKDDEVIHHIDGNKHNNSITNLMKEKRKDHTSRHSKLTEMIEIKCNWCGSDFTIPARMFRFKKYKKGQNNFYCSRHCQVVEQQKNKRDKKLEN